MIMRSLFFSDTVLFIHIVIFDQDFNAVNFNNIEWFLNLSFQFIYKKSLNIPLSVEQFQKEFRFPASFLYLFGSF